MMERFKVMNNDVLVKKLSYHSLEGVLDVRNCNSTIQHFNNLSEDYSSYYEAPKNIMDYEKVKRMEKALSLVEINKSNKILDIGVGGGHLLQELYRKNKYVSLYGMDISIGMIKTALKNTKNVEFFVGSVDKTPLKSNSFDVVFCLGVIGYLPEESLETILKELRRILKDGGVLVFSFGNKASLLRLIREYYNKTLFFFKKILLKREEEYNYKTYNPKNIISKMEKMNLKIEEEHYMTFSTGMFSNKINFQTSKCFR